MKLKSLLTGALGAVAILSTSCSTSSPQAHNQTQQEIKIGGSGAAYSVVEVLASAYEEKQPNTQITFMPSNQTSGGVTGVKDGLIDIGTTSRQLTPSEGSGIEYREIAKEALIIATHPSVTGITNLQTEEVQGIYSGKIKNWQELGGPNAAIILLDIPEDESEKMLLRTHHIGKDLEVTSDAVVLPTEDGIVDLVKDTPYAVGPMFLITTVVEQLPVNRLSLDGIEPTPTNIRNGSYKMVQPMGIVWQGEPTSPSRQFIDFALSEEAAEILQAAGYAPIAKPNN